MSEKTAAQTRTALVERASVAKLLAELKVSAGQYAPGEASGYEMACDDALEALEALAALESSPPSLPTAREVRQFPIMDSKRITSIPWDVIQPHWRRAERNHDQSLDKLASRGGLSPAEALAVLLNRDLEVAMSFTREAAEDALVTQLASLSSQEPPT